MPVERRLRRLFVIALAVPVIALVYATALGSRLWSIVRPGAAAVLGATVIGSVYAEHAWQYAPAPVRMAPLRAAAVMALALIFASASLPGAPVRAAGPAEMALDKAHAYIGTPYRLGAEGPQTVDCSGLIFRVFSDIGELPRVSGRRLRAIGYYRWFAARGLATTEGGERGDLVVYKDIWHIGFYLGDGKVLSALGSGVKIHPLHGITSTFVAFLKVDWSVGDPAPEPEPDEDGADPGKPDGDPDVKPRPRRPRDSDKPDDPAVPTETDSTGPRGFASGTMNLRDGADPDGRIIGWVSRGTTFEVLGSGESPSGALWYEVKTRSGKTGWVYSRWARMLED